jgi:5-methylcytosine-specific restriction endonuclease McrA
MAHAEDEANPEPTSVSALQSLLRTWRQGREARKTSASYERNRRARLSTEERARILAKTDSRCHICGGLIAGSWQADHVLAHSGGGKHVEDNYLPAHALCNNYRWDYLSEEFQYILKLGVWARTQIERDCPLGRQLAHAFVAYEQRRRSRRRASLTKSGPAV